MWQGDQYDHERLPKRALVAILVVDAFHGVATIPVTWTSDDLSAIFYRLLAILPTQVMSNAGLVLFGCIMAFRYRFYGLSVLFVALLYALLQQPRYYTLIAHADVLPVWWSRLTGIAAYLLAVTFYWCFLTPLRVAPRQPLPVPQLVAGVSLSPSLGRALKWLPVVALGAIGHFLGALAADLFHP
jgi:hypothetical protein